MEENNTLQIVEYSDQRILTTAQIAEAYGTTPQIVSNNFNRNKRHFTEGKHYYCLESEALKDFVSTHQTDLSTNLVNNKKLNKLYLWTEKGAWLLAKSLNTDEAWEACEKLVDDYYRVKGQLAVALTFVEKAKVLLDALGKGDPLAVMQSVQLLDLSLLNTVDAVLDILAEQQQAKLQPKRIDYPLSQESKEVLDVLDQAGCPVTAKELAIMLRKDEIAVLKTIFHMACREEIKRVDDAYVSLVLQD